MTIDDLNALAALTAADEVPVWDKEESGEPTKKITASNLAASVKSIGSLIGTGDLDSTPTQGSTNPVTSGGVYTAIQQSTAYSEGNIDTSAYTSNQSTLIAKARKYGKHVWIDLRMVFTNSVKLPTNTNAATVPTGYRPNSAVHIPALIQVNNADAWIPYEVTIGTDGSIKQNFTSSCTGIAILSSGYCI